MLRKFFTFIIFLVPWFLVSFLPFDYSFYEEIRLPWFAPPMGFYVVAWTIVYILITISIICLLYSYKVKELPLSYKITLLVNYLFNQSYTLVFFGLKNSFLGFVSCVGTLLSTLFLVSETYNLKPKCSKFLIPYIVLGIFAVILSFSIFVINL